MPSQWFRRVFQVNPKPHRKTHRQQESRLQPRLHELEDRTLPSVLPISVADPTLPSYTPNGVSSLSYPSTAASSTVSADGRYVVFVSSAPNLVPGDTNNANDVFVRDTKLGTTTLVSVNELGTGPGNRSSQDAVISPDGRYVAFDSFATNLVAHDTNSNENVYVRDLVSGTTTLVSASNKPVSQGGSSDTANSSSLEPSLSVDSSGGVRVAFLSYATDLATTGPNSTNGYVQVYVRNLNTDSTVLVSVNSAGTNGASGYVQYPPEISADGTHVAFSDSATDVAGTPHSTNGQTQVYLRDLGANTTTLVSVNSAGTNGGNNASYAPVLSADGRRVAFYSYASDLVANDNNGSADVFVRDLSGTTPTTILVSASNKSVSAGGTSDTANAYSYFPSISADGSEVAFASSATNLAVTGPNGTNSYQQVYLYRLTTQTTTLLSVNNNTNSPNGGDYNSTYPILSADGSHVAFVSQATDLAVTGPNNAAFGEYQVFLSDVSGTSPATVLVSANSANTGAGDNVSSAAGYYSTVFYPQLDAAGGHVFFDSLADNLVSSDFNGQQDVFERDVAAASTSAISVRDPATAPSITPGGISYGSSQTGGQAVVSADGRYVAFVSAAPNIAPGDNNFASDVFVRDQLTGTTTLVSVNDSGTGTGNGASLDPVISPDGRYVAFDSYASNLVPNDNNGTEDVFVRDLRLNTTTLVSTSNQSVSAGGTSDSANQYSFDPSISVDNSGVVRVAFLSYASNLAVTGPNNTGYSAQVYVRTLGAGGDTVLASVNAAGTSGGNESVDGYPVLSADGTHVAFVDRATDLIPPGSANSTNFTDQVYLRDLVHNTTTLVSVNAAGTNGGNNSSSTPVLSADGLQVAFVSNASDLVAAGIDTNNEQDVFYRNLSAATPTTVLLDVGSDGTSGSGSVSSSGPSISADGTRVAFTCNNPNLLPNLNSYDNVFVHDFTAGTTMLVSASLNPVASRGYTDGGNSSSFAPSLSSDGRFVAFESYATDLSAQNVLFSSTLNVFIRDLATGTATLVSTIPAGVGGNGDSTYPAISADGETVSFQSSAPNLVPDDLNGLADEFAYDAPVSVVSFTPPAVSEGETFNGTVATFTSPFADAAAANDYNATITWGDGAVTAGTVTYSNGVFSVAGTHTYSEEGSGLVFSVQVQGQNGSAAPLESATINVSDAPITVSGVTPPSVTEGVPFSGAVATFTDANPNAAVGDFTATVNWGDGQSSSTTAGTVTVQSLGNGVFQISSAHSYAEDGSALPFSVQVADKGGAATAVDAAVTVADAPLTLLSVDAPHARVGDAFSGTLVTFGDGNTVAPTSDFTVTVHWGDGTTSSTADGGVTVSSLGNGTFAVSAGHAYTQAGNLPFAVTIQDVGGAAVTSPAATAVVDAGFPAELIFGQQPKTSMVGAPLSPAVTVLVEDAYGNVVTGDSTDTLRVSLANNPSGAALGGTVTSVVQDGVATFGNLSLNKAGTGYTLLASSGVLSTAMSSPFDVSSAVTHFTVSVPSGARTAGVAFNVTITALDALNHPVTAYRGTVHFSTSDHGSQTILPADYTFTAGDAGQHTFASGVTLTTAGSQSLAVADKVSPTVHGTLTGIQVVPAAASSLSVTGFPGSILSGTPHGFVVTARDPFGNRATSFRDTVHFDSSASSRTLPPNYTFTSTDNGAHTFTATLATTGAQSLSAADVAHAQIVGTETAIGVYKQPGSVSGPAAGVRGQPMAFTFNATADSLPDTALFTYHIDWNGDGIIDQTAKGPDGLMLTHVYPATGKDTIRVTATDAAGKTTGPVVKSVSIGTALLETDPIDPMKTALFVGGTSGSDTIILSPAAGDTTGTVITVQINGVAQGSSFTPTGHIFVYGQGGSDHIREVANNGVLVTLPAYLFAGSGATTLDATGSSADNVLVGGGGADTLLGGSGRDLLIGGAGASVLHGGGGDDILIGGSTAFDTNVQALSQIMTEWTSSDDYLTRVNDLYGTGTGGLNGDTFLNPTTVHRHTTIDQLFGDAGEDWFLFSPFDQLNDLTTPEVATGV